MAKVVGDKGQLVIEKRLREAPEVEPGSVNLQAPIGPEHRRSLRGILERPNQPHVPPEKWEAARQKAWEAAAREAEEGIK